MPRPPLFKKRALGHPGLFLSCEGFWGSPWNPRGSLLSRSCQICNRAEQRPEPIVQANFEHLNFAARRERVPRKGPGPNVRSSSLRKSYSNFADQFPPNAHSTPPPTTQPLFRLDALIAAPVFRFVCGTIVDPSSAGLAIKERAAAKHHAEPSGQRRYPARVCRSLESSEARNKTAIPGRVERCPVEVPLSAENNVAKLVVDAELAAANKSAAV